MRRFAALLPLVLLLSCNANGPDSGDDVGTPLNAFNWGYCGAGRQPAALTADGGYLAYGFRRFSCEQEFDAQLIRLDASGRLDWALPLGGDAADYGADIAAHPAGGWLLAGSTRGAGPGSMNAWLLLVDDDGEIARETHYGRARDTWIEAMEVLPDGSAAMAGLYDSDVSELGVDAALIVADADGVENLNLVYEDRGDDVAYDVAAVPGGGFVLACGNEYLGPTSFDDFERMWIIKTDAAGDSLWSRFAHGGQTCFAAGVDVCANGDVVVTGETPTVWQGFEATLRVMRYDADGELLWDRAYDGLERAGGRSIRELPSGDLIVAGATWYASTASRTQAYTLRLAPNGDELWHHIQSVPSPESLSAHAAIPLADGGVIVTGTNATVNDGHQVWLTRLDGEGRQHTVD